MTQVALNTPLSCSGATIQFDGTRGAIVKFVLGTVNWADVGFPIARLVYRTFNETDFDYMAEYYGGNAGYSKYNSTCKQPGCANPVDGTWFPTMTQLWWDQKTCTGVTKLNFPTPVVQDYGAPQTAFVKFELKATKTEITLELGLVIWEKTTTRLPEQMMVEFRPKKDNLDWQMDKLGSWVSPTNVALNGSQYQHAVWSGFRGLDTKDGTIFSVETPDAPLVAPITPEKPFPGWGGTPTVMPVPTRPIKAVNGMAINLWNNVWDTNYILWYPYDHRATSDQNMLFRFRVSARVQ